MTINQLLIKLAATKNPQQVTDKGELFNNFEKNKHGGSLANVVDNKLKQKDPKAYRKQLLETLKAKVGLNKMASVIKRAGLPRPILIRIAGDMGIPQHRIFKDGNFYRIMEEASRRSALVRAKKSLGNSIQKNNYDLPRQKPYTQPKRPEGPEQLEFEF